MTDDLGYDRVQGNNISIPRGLEYYIEEPELVPESKIQTENWEGTISTNSLINSFRKLEDRIKGYKFFASSQINDLRGRADFRGEGQREVVQIQRMPGTQERVKDVKITGNEPINSNIPTDVIVVSVDDKRAVVEVITGIADERVTGDTIEEVVRLIDLDAINSVIRKTEKWGERYEFQSEYEIAELLYRIEPPYNVSAPIKMHLASLGYDTITNDPLLDVQANILSDLFYWIKGKVWEGTKKDGLQSNDLYVNMFQRWGERFSRKSYKDFLEIQKQGGADTNARRATALKLLGFDVDEVERELAPTVLAAKYLTSNDDEQKGGILDELAKERKKDSKKFDLLKKAYYQVWQDVEDWIR